MAEKKRRYCKNKTPGSRRGKKWPEEVRTGVLMEMIHSNNICAVARRWGVPESTIRGWIAEELDKPGESIFVQERRRAAREIAARAAASAAEHLGYLQQRVAANARNAEICANLRGRLDEDARAKDWEQIGRHLSTEAERAAAAETTALVEYASPGSYDRQLSAEQREEIQRLMELHAPMDDRSAAMMASTLMDIASRAAALAGPTETQQMQEETPVLYMEPETMDPGESVQLDE